MTTRLLILIAVSVGAFQLSRAHAQSEGADNFIPNEPPKSGADPHATDSHSVKYTLLLPTEKSSEAVTEAERNPFGKSDDELHDSGGKSSSEETKIQEQLSKLRATGLSPGPEGLRVLLGDMWLSKNDVVPAVIKDQTLALRVNEVTRDAIQLVWMEKKFTGLPPRLLVIPVDLRATVRRVPHGQLLEKPENKKESLASKRATAVELPVSIAAIGDPAELRKAAQAALAPVGLRTPAQPSVTATPAPAAPAPNDANIIPAAPGTLPSLKRTTPSITAALAAKSAGPSAALSAQPPAGDNTGASPPPSAVTALAKPSDSGQKADETPVAPPPSPEIASQPSSPGATQTAAPPASEPAAWKRAMGLMENLVKLSEADKK